MAWRIDQQVIRGEIDNRERGRVRGRIWFVGLEQPVELDLQGNPMRDLAGRRLQFENPNPEPGDLSGLQPLQQGQAGDITAARKCKVPDLPIEECLELAEAGKEFPWHLANVLYLEWYSQSNGRVVIEAPDYVLKLDGEPTYELSDADELEQVEAGQRSMMDFMNRLEEAIADAEVGDHEDEGRRLEVEEQEDAPTSKAEARAEEETAWMDKLSDRIAARMKREGWEEADHDEIYREEREKLRQEGWDPHAEVKPDDGEEVSWQADWREDASFWSVEEGNDDGGWDVPDDMEHEDEPEDLPLVKRGLHFASSLFHKIKAEGWLPAEASMEHPMQELIDSSRVAAVKLSGALTGARDGRWPPESWAAGDVLVRLKRSRAALRDALRMVEACEEQQLGGSEWLGETRAELHFMRKAVNLLIDEVRGGLQGQ